MKATALSQMVRSACLPLLAAFLVLFTAACRATPREVVLFFPPRAFDSSTAMGSSAAQPGDASMARTNLGVSIRQVLDRRDRPQVVGVTRGPGSLVTGQVLATNDGGLWVRAAAEYELQRLGFTVLKEASLGTGSPAPLQIDLELLEARAAAGVDFPGQVLLSATVRLNDRVHWGRRLAGTSTFNDPTGVPVDTAESLAIALRNALAPLTEVSLEIARSQPALNPVQVQE